MTPSLEPPHTDLATAIDRIKRELAAADVLALPNNATQRERAACIKAWSYVWLSAAVEQFVTTLLQAVLLEINTQALAPASMSMSLLAMLFGSEFQSLQSRRGLKDWEKRLEILALVEGGDHIPFNTTVLPLDGRTIGPDHLGVIWSAFGFDGSPIPSGRHRDALKELREGRNAVAHGREEPVSFGRRKTAGDVMGMVDLIEDIADNFMVTADDFLQSKAYAR